MEVLTIETKVFAERLCSEEFKAFICKMSDSPSIRFHITGSKALIGAVHDNKQIFLPAQLRDLVPLFLGGVHSCGIVGNSVENDNRLWRSILE